MMKKYQLGIHGEKIDVGLDVSPDNTGGTLFLHGREYQVQFTSLGGHSWFIECDGQCTQAYAIKSEDGTHVFADGQVCIIEDPGKPKTARSRTGSLKKGLDIVTPPTPAMVERILVETGQTVDQGQSLIVVSAMKMEMTLAAPYAGVVAAVNAKVGAQVAPGDILVEITASEAKLSQQAATDKT